MIKIFRLNAVEMWYIYSDYEWNSLPEAARKRLKDDVVFGTVKELSWDRFLSETKPHLKENNDKT